ncbi:MAG: HAMP domain-containing sensor histidine kinase, partial [Bacillota bacterium]|nr:HAMP domain-containing sensor histidine kinase [Bacillota bacterium]
IITDYLLDWHINERREELTEDSKRIADDISYYLSVYDSSIYKTYLKSVANKYGDTLNSRIIILDEEKRVVADSNDEFNFSTLELLEIEESLQGEISSNNYYFSDIGNVMYIGYPVIFEDEINGSVFISESINNLYEKVNSLIYKIKVLIIVISFLIIVGLYFLTYFFLKPINKFYPAIENIKKGDLGQKVNIKTRDEFNLLGEAFNSMTVRLNEVDEQREAFVANVSHELKTPLASIKLLTENLLLQENIEKKVYREFLEDINDEIDRLNNIVTELLSLVDLDKNKLKLNYQITYLNYILEKIIEQLNPLAKEKNIKLVLEEKDRIQIKMDKDKIKQAIINVVHNAIKYSEEDTVVKVSLYSDKSYATIKVSDTGFGIPKESIPYIFDRFYRVDKARSRKTGGTGLGLSISKQIINMHHGTINVKSRVGKGTTFYIKIPLEE